MLMALVFVVLPIKFNAVPLAILNADPAFVKLIAALEVDAGVSVTFEPEVLTVKQNH